MLRCIQTGCVCALLATVSIGCGGSKELGPATTTPQIDEAKVKQEMEKSKEMSMEMMKKAGKSIPPGAGSGSPDTEAGSKPATP